MLILTSLKEARNFNWKLSCFRDCGPYVVRLQGEFLMIDILKYCCGITLNALGGLMLRPSLCINSN